MIRRGVVLVAGLSVVLAPGVSTYASPNNGNRPRVDFAAQVRPILQERCFDCHGIDAQEAGLRLDVRRRAFDGADSGKVIVPGSATTSRLIERIVTNDRKRRMPLDGERLADDEIDLLRAWIDQGADWPDRFAGQESGDNHWAFQPVVRPAVPAPEHSAWCRGSIDRFVLTHLAANGLTPSPSAERPTLIRRLFLDLVGLLPTPEQVDDFVADSRPDAYERLVDRLLGSPHFGERWGRHWLDLARYADSAGYEADPPRTMWPYREWVIDAVNSNMPFDRFVIEQIAGDLLPNAGRSQLIAAGFHCNALFDANLRYEAILDRLETTGTVFLGLTVGCARCHSHKTDPLTQREFYQLYAFFNDASMGPLELASHGEIARRNEMQKRRDQLQQTLADCEAALANAEQTPPEKSKHEQERRELSAELKQLSAEMPVIQTTLTMRHAPAATHVFLQGDPHQPGEPVQPGVPAFLHELAASDSTQESEKPTRFDLARWIVADENPLTARVTVNRIWQRYFGRGLVETAGDFGVQTPPPSHPELLDWLAAELMESDWQMKALHRRIVCSATYRQSSAVPDKSDNRDPKNRWLSHQNRLHVDAEVIRDVALDAGGLLSRKLGGPSVFPYQPPGVLDNRATPAEWHESRGADRYRRGMYTWFWRLTPHPQLTLFDAPDGVTSCTRRDRSNTPLQALTLLNDPMFVECAFAMSDRVLACSFTDETNRLRYAFRLCLAREPTETELRLIQELLHAELLERAAQTSPTSPDSASAAIGSMRRQAEARRGAWAAVCRTLMNLDEFMTRE